MPIMAKCPPRNYNYAANPYSSRYVVKYHTCPESAGLDRQRQYAEDHCVYLGTTQYSQELS